MQRVRLKENQALPKRWARKHNAIYYRVPPGEVHLWDNKSWFRLGKSLAEAHQTFSQRLYQSGATVLTMQDLLDKFEFEYMPKLKPATQKYYLYALPMLRQGFTQSKILVSQVQPHHAYEMVEFLERTESTKKAKQAAECLSSSLSYAVKLGVISRNPLIGQFKKPSTKGRSRAVTDEELIAFSSLLPRKWQLYLSLKLHSRGRRKGELLSVTRKNLTASGILFVNNKRTSDSFVITWTPTLRQIITEILELHPSDSPEAHLFYGRGEKPYIKPDGQTSGFDSIWQRYMKKAVAAGLCEHFTEHDLRAKAVEDESLEVASRLLRHTSSQVTMKHYRRKPEEL